MEAKPHLDDKSLKLNVLQTPFCGELRSKKFYMNGQQIVTTAEGYYDSTGYTWCYHTQMALGPDGAPAVPEECGPDRKCYRSAVEKPDEYAVIANSRINGRLV
jgi:hypothetical protein